MPAERYFIKTSLNDGDTLSLEDQEYHHLVHVMRSKPGETVEVVNGMGQLAKAVIRSIEKKQVILDLQSVIHEVPPKHQIILAQAIPRPNRLDFILEKGTELGMTQLWLFPGKQSERKEINDHQVERMQSVMISAMKQCGRLYLPKIEIKPTLEKWTNFPSHAYFGDVGPEAEIFEKAWKPVSEIVFFIGPESGFTANETSILQKNCKGVKLHGNILRTDTAALSALSLVSHWLMSD